ncbi:hypothetical protein SEUCBS140593_002159 [Sporothrix eucalyptigena]|uniref:Small secreted protein n=1 Tax=Sporothrix eucalyptigena TaxID=1812306 RepID=A0ABP0B4A1_9PEZI
MWFSSAVAVAVLSAAVQVNAAAIIRAPPALTCQGDCIATMTVSASDAPNPTAWCYSYLQDEEDTVSLPTAWASNGACCFVFVILAASHHQQQQQQQY